METVKIGKQEWSTENLNVDHFNNGDEIQQIEADRLKAENAAKLREDDYQLAYAIDILSGLSAISIQN